MADLTPRPARTIEEATAALQDFEQPLQSGDARYVDFSPARGDDSRHGLRTKLLRKQPGRPLHIVFSSHRGAGKSTELLRLIHELQERYHALYLEANVEMDAFSIDLEDLLLVLTRAVCEEMVKIKLPLPDALLKEVSDWFSQTIEQTVAGKSYVGEMKASAEAGAVAGPFGKLMASLTALFRVESSHRSEVKEVLRKYPGALMAAVNKVLDAAHRRLKAERGQELLIVIDNLDRYEPAVVEKLLVGQAERFQDLHCNLIMTPPIAMLYRPGAGRLGDLFAEEVMCTIKMREPKESYAVSHGEGYKLLLQALGARIDLDLMLPDRAARLRLLVASGGSVRDLLKLTADASLRIDDGPITLAAVERVVSRLRSRMRDEINTNKGWKEALQRISATKAVSAANEDLDVLFHRLAFKFNGKYWYDVHPLIAEMEGILSVTPPSTPD